ncbi:MAG: hypothetical protein ACR2PA_02785 [Hyphomicrobiaceae bacterium]
MDKPILNFSLTLVLLAACGLMLFRRDQLGHGTKASKKDADVPRATETEQPGLDMGKGLLGPLWRNDKSDVGSR